VHLPDGYIEGMLGSYSKERVQRDVMGSFDSFEGMIYSEFDRNIHVVAPYAIPIEWTKVVGLDHGFTNATAAMFGAIDHDGNIVIYKEFYQSEWIIKDIVQRGLNPMMKGDKIDAIYIDPSTRAKKGQLGLSDFSAYLEYLPPKVALVCANNEVATGIDRVKTFLRVNPKNKKPRLTIFDTCVNLLDEIGEYRWQELSANQEGTKNTHEAPRKYHDHAVDALRYLVMSRPDPAKKEKNNDKFWTMESSIQKELESIRKPKEKDPFKDY